MRIHRWGAAILVAGTVTLSGAAAFAAAPAGTGHAPWGTGRGGHMACAAGMPGGPGPVGGWRGVKGAWSHGVPAQAGAGSTPAAPQGGGNLGGASRGVPAGRPGPFGPRGMGLGCRPGMPPMQAMLQAASSYLGLSVQQITADIQSGESLNTIANSVSGKSPAGLQAALLAAVQAQLAKLVTANKLTGVREQKILAAIQSRLPQLMAGTWTPRTGSAPAMPVSPSGSTTSTTTSGTGA